MKHPNKFNGLSHSTLQNELLSRMSQMANLRKESKLLRERIVSVRSELYAVEHEIQEIQSALGIPMKSISIPL